MTHDAQGDVEPLGILWMLDLNQPLPESPEARVPATFQRADPALAHELAKVMGFDNPEPVEQRFSMGKQCFVARVDGKLVAYGWVTFDEEKIGEHGLQMRLRSGEAYIWDCATVPAMRGLRLYPTLLAYMLQQLQQAGYQRIWIGMDADNLPSQRGVAHVGFHPIVTLVRIPGAPGLWTRGCAGASAQDIADAQYALFGSEDPSRIVPQQSSS